MTSITPERWHERFRQQAGWTYELRKHLFEQIGVQPSAKILEPGCGTGAVLSEITGWGSQHVFGLDLNLEYLHLAFENAPGVHLAGGDAHHLPYARDSFDVIFCHYLLLWVMEPDAVVKEMARVTRWGGFVLLLAEPDYGGRIDHPQELDPLGKYQTAALRRQRADPEIGRRLTGLLSRAGLKDVQGGVLGGGWAGAPSTADWEIEWQVLRDDLDQLNGEGRINRAKLDVLQNIDRKAWQDGERVLFVPTFYAWGKKR